MSKINPGLYSSEDHTWETPPEILQAILRFEGVERFDLDPACSRENVPARRHYLDPKSKNPRTADGLVMQWTHPDWPTPVTRVALVFLNPPFGSGLRHWLKKCVEESRAGRARIWALVPSRTETTYQHEHGLTVAAFSVFLRGRLQFLRNGMKNGTAPFPSLLLYYDADEGRAAEMCDRWANAPPLPGTVLCPYREWWFD